MLLSYYQSLFKKNVVLPLDFQHDGYSAESFLSHEYDIVDKLIYEQNLIDLSDFNVNTLSCFTDGDITHNYHHVYSKGKFIFKNCLSFDNDNIFCGNKSLFQIISKYFLENNIIKYKVNIQTDCSIVNIVIKNVYNININNNYNSYDILFDYDKDEQWLELIIYYKIGDKIKKEKRFIYFESFKISDIKYEIIDNDLIIPCLNKNIVSVNLYSNNNKMFNFDYPNNDIILPINNINKIIITDTYTNDYLFNLKTI